MQLNRICHANNTCYCYQVLLTTCGLGDFKIAPQNTCYLVAYNTWYLCSYSTCYFHGMCYKPRHITCYLEQLLKITKSPPSTPKDILVSFSQSEKGQHDTLLRQTSCFQTSSITMAHPKRNRHGRNTRRGKSKHGQTNVRTKKRTPSGHAAL